MPCVPIAHQNSPSILQQHKGTLEALQVYTQPNHLSRHVRSVKPDAGGRSRRTVGLHLGIERPQWIEGRNAPKGFSSVFPTQRASGPLGRLVLGRDATCLRGQEAFTRSFEVEACRTAHGESLSDIATLQGLSRECSSEYQSCRSPASGCTTAGLRSLG